jgi:general secretion pathway protein B
MSYILDALRKADAQRERDPARGIHAQPGRASLGDNPRGAGLRAGVWAASAAGIAALAIAGWYVYRDPVTATGQVQLAAVPAAAPRVTAPPPAAPHVPPPVVPAPVVLPPPVVVAPTVASVRPAPMPDAALPSRRDRPAGGPPPMPGQVGMGATARAMAQANQASPAPTQPAQPTQPSTQPSTQPPSVAPAAPTAPGVASAPAQPGVPAAQVAAPPQAAPVVPNVAPQPAPYVPPVVVPPSPPPAPVAGLPPDAPKLVITGGVYTASKAQRMLIVNGQVMTEGADLGSGVTLEEIRPKSAVLRFRGGRYAVSY